MQDAAIPAVLNGHDVLIGAATAAGKTEAAFLPVCSALVEQGTSNGSGAQALYVGPLKALINDQFRRTEELCGSLDIPTHRWHGDVAASRKQAVLKNPSGILLITPESLEALFVLRGPAIRRLFAALGHVVVDELHSFIGTERGAQLFSQLHRLETALGRHVPRIGLSATLGDMRLAAEQLRPGGGDRVTVLVSTGGGQEIRLQLRSYVTRRPDPGGETPDTAVRGIADHLFTALRGRTNLVFANSRRSVEQFAAELADRSAAARVPNEFHPHHGNLAKELRQDVEASLRDPSRPATAICTSTLEMGIDIGAVAQVAQIGPLPSVAALRQRLGRSGRRGEAAVPRAYVSAVATDARSTTLDRLQLPLVQFIAAIELLLERWCEPPEQARLHLSTLVQQLLSLIAQHGGATPAEAFRVLCGRGSPFAAVSSAQFATLLRDLGCQEVLVQSADGTLLLGPRGESVVNHYTFYAAFRSPEEYRLVSAGQQLGTMPISLPLYDGLLLVFSGRRWRVVAVHESEKVVELAPAAGGRPTFLGEASGSVHGKIRTRMRELLEDVVVPAYLDSRSVELLGQARRAYASSHLDSYPFLAEGADTIVFPWTGDRTLNTLVHVLNTRGVDASAEGAALRLGGTTPQAAAAALADFAEGTEPDPRAVAATVVNKAQEKFDEWIGESLLEEQFAAADLDCAGAVKVARVLTATRHQDRME